MLLAGAAILLAAAAYIGLGVGRSAPAAVESPEAEAGDALADPAARVRFWEARVAANAEDYQSALHLADAYVDRSRLTGDLGDLERAQAALDAAREHAPDGRPIELRQAQLAFTLHDFRTARSVAEGLLETDPDDPAALGILGDSALELGDEDAADEAYERLAQLPGSPAIWSRLGRYTFLLGDVEGAIDLVSRAAGGAEAEGFPDATAFYRFQLADLYRGQGRLDDAEGAYQESLAAYPDYPPAIAGLGRLREAQGRRPEAIELLERATAALPQPDFVAALGDLYALDEQQAEAEREYALVERIAELGRATGSVYDRQLVLFRADHDRNVDEAVALAEGEIAVRRDVYGYDALAWALYRTGRIDEAAAAAGEAMRLGTPDGRIQYHAGLIAEAAGDTEAGRELLEQAIVREAALPPLQVPAAHAALEELGGG